MKRNQTERNTCVDIMRAILIIAMVTGHSTSPWTTYIYLFHMPSFLILSGYIDRRESYGTGQYVKKKLFAVLLPAMMINLVFICLYSFMQLTALYDLINSGERISLWERIKGMILYWAVPDLGGATWFLIVLFEVQCIVKIMDSVLRKLRLNRIFFSCVFTLGVIGYLLTVQAYTLPWYMDLAMLGCLYYGIGIMLQKRQVLSHMDRRIMIPLAVFSTVFFGSFYFYGEIPMNWPTRAFTDLFIQLWSCLAPAYIVWNIAEFLNASSAAPLLRWVGKHTFCILTLHFVVFRILFGVGVAVGRFPMEQLQHLTPDAEIAYNGGWIVFTLITVLLCSMLAGAAEKNRWTNYLFNAKVPYKI